MAYTLTETFRTKTEAKAAVKLGGVGIRRADGTHLPHANGGPYFVAGKLAHYAEWKGEAYVQNGRVYRLK